MFLLFTGFWMLAWGLVLETFWPNGFMWWEWKAWGCLVIMQIPFWMLLWAIGNEPTHPRM